MIKRSYRFGFIMLLVLLLLPSSAVASSGAFGSTASALTGVLGQLVGLAAGLLDPSPVPPGETTNGGELGTGWDPWGLGTVPTDATPNGDIGPGWDPWGVSTVPTDATPNSDIGHGWDPWG